MAQSQPFLFSDVCGMKHFLGLSNKHIFASENCRMKRTYLILFLLAFLTSCAGLQVFEPIPENSFTNETTFAGYDSDAKVAWIVTTDSSNLYVRMETSHRLSKIKLLKAGMHVYFSTSGKKERSNYVNFPVKQKKEQKASDQDQNQVTNQGGRGKRKRMTTEELIAQINPLAEYHFNGKTTQFHYKIDTSDFKIEIEEDSNSTLRFTIRMPFEKLVTDINDLNGLSIGLVSGAFEIPISSRPMPSSRPTNMPNSGRTPSANQPMGQSRNWQAGSYSELAEPIKIWFKIDKVLQ